MSVGFYNEPQNFELQTIPYCRCFIIFEEIWTLLYFKIRFMIQFHIKNHFVLQIIKISIKRFLLTEHTSN